MYGALQDSKGNISHKRIIAAGAMFAAVALAILGVILDSQVAAQMVWPFIALAGGEGFASAIEGKV